MASNGKANTAVTTRIGARIGRETRAQRTMVNAGVFFILVGYLTHRPGGIEFPLLSGRCSIDAISIFLHICRYLITSVQPLAALRQRDCRAAISPSNRRAIVTPGGQPCPCRET